MRYINDRDIYFAAPSLLVANNIGKEINIDETQPSLTESLKNLARRNDDFSIDHFFTLACENTDARQEKAASFLFDLYTGKEAGHPDLPEQLGIDSLKFFDIVNDRNKEKLPSEAWKVPDKVLIMAGYTCQRYTQ